ncbi:hypothetical protein GCM10027176_78240 [Actinoallomurus bryophytorum]
MRELGAEVMELPGHLPLLLTELLQEFVPGVGRLVLFGGHARKLLGCARSSAAIARNLVSMATPPETAIKEIERPRHEDSSTTRARTGVKHHPMPKHQQSSEIAQRWRS